MSQQIARFNPQGALPASIANALAQTGGGLPSALSEGVGAAYANVSFKGKVFRIKYAGQEQLLVDPASNQPLQFLDLVIVDAKNVLSKTYYATGYSEGSNEQPDCASEDGVTPHAPPGKAVQCNDCRLCPWNAFGSKKSNDGIATNSKACADTRKLAVVPSFNIPNENFGGPMLLRVPAASLTNLAEFDRNVRAAGAPFYAVVVRVTFDYTVAYPKLVFSAQRFLTEDEAAHVLALRADPRTADIIEGLAPPVAPAPVSTLAGQVPASMAPPVQAPPIQPQTTASFGVAPAPQPVPQAQPAPTIPQTGTPVPPPVVQFAPPPVQAPPVQAPPVAFNAPPVQAPPVQAPPVQAPPVGYAAQPPQQAPQGAPVPQPGALPQAVLSAVDNLLA